MNTRLGIAASGIPGWRRFPPNLFAIPFGLAGLAEAWHAAGQTLPTPEAATSVLSIVAALAWVTLLACYCGQGSASMFADFKNKTFSPFISLAPITGMLLASTLSAHAFAAGRALVVVFLVITLVVGGLLTGEWIVAPLDHDSAHPGYFLPTVAGGLVGSFCAASVQLHGLAAASFGVGILCWLLIGATILNRLFFHSVLPPLLVPTLAIELAPPAVAGIAYFALTGGDTGLPAQALAGYTVLMIFVQLRLLPRFLALRFSPAFWAFTFSWAATATDALEWIALRKPPGATAYATVILIAITALVAYIAGRTVLLIARGQLLPPPVPAPPAAAVPATVPPATVLPAAAPLATVPPATAPLATVPSATAPLATVPSATARIIPNEGTVPQSAALAALAPGTQGADQTARR